MDDLNFQRENAKTMLGVNDAQLDQVIVLLRDYHACGTRANISDLSRVLESPLGRLGIDLRRNMKDGCIGG